MADVVSGIPELIEQGKKFAFANFAAKSELSFERSSGVMASFSRFGGRSSTGR